VFEGGTVITHYDADGLIVFLDESEGGIGLKGRGTVDRDGVSGLQGFKITP
jgi:hypothetical protein